MLNEGLTITSGFYDELGSLHKKGVFKVQFRQKKFCVYICGMNLTRSYIRKVFEQTYVFTLTSNNYLNFRLHAIQRLGSFTIQLKVSTANSIANTIRDKNIPQSNRRKVLT